MAGGCERQLCRCELPVIITNACMHVQAASTIDFNDTCLTSDIMNACFFCILELVHMSVHTLPDPNWFDAKCANVPVITLQ